MRQVSIAGIRMVEATHEIVLLLADDERRLPIWIGGMEAASIAMSQQGITPPRPMTHDLVNLVLENFGQPCQRAEITRLEDGVFYADLVLADGRRIGCRPSDAVAVALRAGAPVFVDEAVLDAASIVDTETAQDAEVEAFRAFLEEVGPEDFGTETLNDE